MWNRIRGPFSILISALMFYLATFFVKLGDPQNFPEKVIYLAARFWLGYFLLIFWFRVYKKIRTSDIPVNNTRWLWYRAFWNMIAVLFFYLSVIYGTLTGANILNMTYPIFVALLSAPFLNEKLHLKTWLGVLLAVFGSIFVSLHSDNYLVSSGDLFGILSGLTAGFAIVALRKIRLTDSTEAALFYNFRLGFWFTSPLVLYFFYAVSAGNYAADLIYPSFSAMSGIAGQVALTYGFKYVSAVTGSILSAVRLVFAVILGWLFFQTEITVFSVSGAILILLANLILAFKKSSENSRTVSRL